MFVNLLAKDSYYFLVGLAIALVFFILESLHYLMKKAMKKNISKNNSAFFKTSQKQESVCPYCGCGGRRADFAHKPF